MKLLVIGGAGYIGSHVALALLEKGHEVGVYDNLSTGRRENLLDDAEFFEGDILDHEYLLEVMQKGFDGIIHLAAFKAAGESMQKPEKYSINNITGTLNILNSAFEAGIKNIVFSSSAAVYGSPEYIPMDEKHRTEPENYYGFTKLEIERFLEWYSRLKDIRYAALRYFNAAGYDAKGRIKGLEKNPQNLIPVIMETAIGKRDKVLIFGDDYETRDGTGVRDYVHVTDLAKAHVLALDYITSENKDLLVNLGSEKGISVKEMLESARKITGKEIPTETVERREGDPSEVIASSSKAKKILGWSAQNSDVDTIIKSTWDVYKENSEL